MIPSSPITRRDLLHHAAGGFLGIALGGVMGAGRRAAEPRGSMAAPISRPAANRSSICSCAAASVISTPSTLKATSGPAKLVDVIGFGDNRGPKWKLRSRHPLPSLAHSRPAASRAHRSPTLVSARRQRRGRRDRLRPLDVVQRAEPFPRRHRENCTAHRGRQFDHPTLGSWITYALGTVNQILPAFVNIGRPSSTVQLTGG